MKRLSLMLVLFTLAGLLAACAPAAGQIPTSGVTPQGGLTGEPVMETPTPYDAPLLPPKGALEAQRVLAERLGIDVEAVVIREIKSMEWSDSCLGLGGPAESCLAAITAGYQVTLAANDQDYVYRTDQSGEAVRAEETGPTQVSTATANPPTQGELAAELPREIIQVILTQLNVPETALVILEAEQVDWPDACLGIQKAGMACAQMIVPGYRVVVEANGQTYIFRTDLTGGQVLRDGAGAIKSTGSLRFEKEMGGNCLALSISAGQARLSACAGSPKVVEFSAERWAEWKTLTADFSGFDLTDDAIKMEFAGVGTRKAEAAEQRSVAEWAGLALAEAQAGQADPQSGLVFSWHREGGVAGFCDDLAVYMSGFAAASTCKGQVEPRGRTRLTAEQLEQLYSWMGQYRSFEHEQKDPAVADAMTIQVAFHGSGNQDMPEAVRVELELLATEWFFTAGKAK